MISQQLFTEYNQPPQRSGHLQQDMCMQQGSAFSVPNNNKKDAKIVRQCANYWAPLTHKRHLPQPAQPQHTNDGAPRTRKQQQQEHRPQQPTKRSDPTQHAKGITGDCPGPRKETATRGNVTQGGYFFRSPTTGEKAPCLVQGTTSSGVPKGQGLWGASLPANRTHLNCSVQWLGTSKVDHFLLTTQTSVCALMMTGKQASLFLTTGGRGGDDKENKHPPFGLRQHLPNPTCSLPPMEGGMP